MKVKVLMINSPTIPVTEEQMREIRELTGATEEEVVVVSSRERAYAEARAHRSTLKLIILAASWSVSLVNDLYACVHGTCIRLLAVCTNRKWYPEIESICHLAVDSVDKLTEMVRSSTNTFNAATA